MKRISIKERILFIINSLKLINFDEEQIKNEFKEHIDSVWKERWLLFDNVIWRYVIEYCLINSEHCKTIKLGKLFKNSNNGIYDYIKSGISLGQIRINDDILRQDSDQGLIVLDINSKEIFCYYKIDMGGCPTCGYDFVEGVPDLLELYFCDNKYDLIEYCITEYDRVAIYHYLGGMEE